MFATTTDVADQWRPLSDAETQAALSLLTRVSALMRLQRPTLEDRAAASPDLTEVARGVAVDAVLRVVKNPDGKVQESLDDYAYRRSDAVADGVLYVTEAEWALLDPPSTGGGMPHMGTARVGSWMR